MLSKEHLQDGLRTDLVGRKLFVFESLDSTNACAKTLAEAGAEEGSVVVTEFQTQGRGRQGKSWLAEPGTNLLFSVILRPQLPKENSGLLTFFAAVSVSKAVESAVGTKVECKWPNDLLLDRKKFCGILLENSLEKEGLGYSIVGIGVNVNQRSFDQFLGNVTSLALAKGRDCDRTVVFQRILEELDALYKEVQEQHFDKILKEWDARCHMYGHGVTVAQKDRTISGTAVGLNADGGLVLRTSSGNTVVYAGDVTVLK